MTDKMIIDNVDVSGCVYRYYKNRCYFDSSKENTGEERLTGRGGCEYNPNCYYKKFKRKEEKCEMLKKDFTELIDIVNPYMDDFTGYNEETGSFDIVLCVKELLEQTDKLLQAEKEKVKELEKRFKSSESWRIRAEDMNEKFSLEVNIYKQVLEEIKEMLEFQIEQINIYPLKTNLGKILQKCEVLKDE